jgi:hypothetical protein
MASYQTKTVLVYIALSKAYETAEQHISVEPPSQTSAFDIIGTSMLGCLHLSCGASLGSCSLSL